MLHNGLFFRRKGIIVKKKLIVGLVSVIMFGCAQQSSDSVSQPNMGQQYKDGNLPDMFNPVSTINSELLLTNSRVFRQQTQMVTGRSPSMATKYQDLYRQVTEWMAAGAYPDRLDRYMLNAEQLSGGDNQGNVLMTGYYSPVLELRHRPDSVYKYPIYANPQCGNACPTRAEINWGALDGQGLELGYSASALDNFMLEVQGSGFVHYGDNDEWLYFGYSGKNNHAYTSIGKVLIDRGEVPKEEMSLAAIETWASQQDEDTLFELLEQNESFVFFKPTEQLDVIGSAGIPLLANASVAADRAHLPMGSVLLIEVPVLDEQGVWTGRHELRLVLVLDTGGAVKGNHLDLYHGKGDDAGTQAGHYKHFGRVWKIDLI
uniref:murein transglycosylase A n=1 Tax=Thaumasiovibrio occultus TaxID=1891184 RepID=UPI000B363F9A|nr:murein transglycosylase A [Thaumasiovibrio occultus]